MRPDYATELNLAKEKIQQLDSAYSGQKSENERLKHAIHELEEKAESSELQINAISREYRSLLEEKEREINKLKQQHHELLEHQAKVALHSSQEAEVTSALSSQETRQSQDYQDDGFDGWATEEWGDFDDSLRLQREINHLRQEVVRLHADSQHWRSVAGQLSQAGGVGLDQQAQHEILNLQAKVKELEKNAATAREEAQHEIASLQDVHRSKLAALKKTHKEEINQLKSKVSDLEQQLADATIRDVDSMRAAGSSLLPESDREECDVSIESVTMQLATLQAQLTSIIQEKNKLFAANKHLEGLVEELQEEVGQLQTVRDEQAARITELQVSIGHQAQLHVQEVKVLQHHIEEYKEEQNRLVQGEQQVGLDLFLAKQCLLDQLDANHADIQDLLSNVSSIRQQLSSQAAERQECLLIEKQAMANRLYSAGLQESRLKLGIAEASMHMQETSKEAADLIEKLGDSEQQEKTAAFVDAVEKENLLLREEKVKLQEQIALLERQVSKQFEDWKQNQDTISSLRQQLRVNKDREGYESENTLDQSFTSGSNHLNPSERDKGDETSDWQIEKEALEDVLVHLRQELRQKEEHIMHLSEGKMESQDDNESKSLREELALLKQEQDAMQTELSIVRDSEEMLQLELSSLREREEVLHAERLELETSLGELDDQYQETTNHLIAVRDSLQVQLAAAQLQVKELQEELERLQHQEGPVTFTSAVPTSVRKTLEVHHKDNGEQMISPTSGTNSPTDSSSSSFEMVEDLKQELKKTQDELAASAQQLELREVEVTELKVKLQKGTMALNELHMDKRELEEALRQRKEEVEEKVAKIKTFREEKLQLSKENKDLSERLQELEDELESWQQNNEDVQVGKKDRESLRVELVSAQTELSTLQQRLDSMFTEAEELRAQCKKLQMEKDRISEDMVSQREMLFREKEAALQKIGQLESEMTAQKDLLSAHAISRGSELESQMISLKEQVDMERAEKEQLQKMVYELEKQLTSRENVSCSERSGESSTAEVSVESLQRLNQDLVHVLSRQKIVLEKMQQIFFAGQALEEMTSSESGNQDLVSQSLPGLWEQNCHLLNSLRMQLGVMEEITKQDVIQMNESWTPVELTKESLVTQPSFAESDQDGVNLLTNNQQLLETVRAKDVEIFNLTESLTISRLQNKEVENAVAAAADRHQSLVQLLSERECELQALKEDNISLLSLCEEIKAKLGNTESSANSLTEKLQDADKKMQQLKVDQASVIECSTQSLIEENKQLKEFAVKVEDELSALQEKITRMEAELKEKEDILLCHQTGIQEMNNRFEEQAKALVKEKKKTSQQEDVMVLLRETLIKKDQEIEMLKSQLHNSFRFLSPEHQKIIREEQSLLPSSPRINLPALEFPQKPAIELRKDTEDTEFSKEKEDKAEIVKDVTSYAVEEVDDDEEISIQAVEDMASFVQSVDDLRLRLQEKDQIISDLQQQNSRFLQILDSHSLTEHSSKDAASVHKLESEVKALKLEKEQMMAVLNEKSREASSLKAEVMRLMNVISAEKSVIEKLKRDNQELSVSRVQQKDDILDGMHREALQNLSRLVRDREVEIEALKQKNETLMAVLQDLNQGGGTGSAEGSNMAASLGTHLADKENLEKQLAALQAEREQMVAFVNQKHSESLAYHAEIQRLIALRSEENQHSEQLQAEYDKLCQQFEDKTQSLLKAQNDIINYRQKCAELEVKYGEMLQKSNASGAVDSATYHLVEEEKDRLATKQDELRHMLHERDEKIRAVTQKANELENSLLTRDSENNALKKHVDSLTFQLQTIAHQKEDIIKEKETLEEKMQQREQEVKMLKDINDHFTLTVREKEFEVASLQERLQKMLALASEQQGEKTQVAQLLQDQEAAAAAMGHLQQERDQLMLALKQRQQDLNTVQTENLRLKEKEHKLGREVERLRGHLLQIEEGYTREALEAEEREKNLRNRLAAAEEKLLSSTHDIQRASQQASQRVENLQQQLHVIASQRDAAYMQVAGLQDQCQQYSTSLSNLQLVLEQFQREKESQVAIETEHYQKQAQQLREKVQDLQTQLQQTKLDLEEASDGLAAASRLSEQLDLKEEVIQTLKEEVKQREEELKKAEEDINKLSSSTDAKVDKVLMKNLILSYFHTPDKNRMDAIHSIGGLLGFTQEEFRKIEESQGQGGWVASFLKRAPRSHSTTPPSTPIHKAKDPGLSQSFSQLFVNFLEKESSPPPAPIRLPAEEMAREAQQRHLGDPRSKPVFNPFTAPRHVSMPLSVGPYASTSMSPNSHLLMAPPGSPTSSFPVFTPFTFSEESRQSASQSSSVGGVSRPPPQTSSTILKDVLGSR
ncbi:thyroid receptor-interacting protein 11-like isoform X4 [Pomacea canaliculata]|uniref:thyroid receptor-interacting protein 11-like isoform X4 n=1 Tax=Pomacea canaliculata TaxID=400727 RepID=UPI000D73422F|nr:thyroid receptor-interacting protein 11-like isoform X4 [Pomacea canaliculata]